MSIFITIIHEDELSEAVMSKLLHHFDDKFEIWQSYPGNGFGYLKKNIRGFNQAANINPHFMLTDLDNYRCVIELKNDWIDFDVNSNLIFRIAVKEVESWILADKEGVAAFFNIPAILIPDSPDLLQDPKNTLIQLAKRSRKRVIREDIVPINSNATIGPNYNGCLSEYVFKLWSVESAITRSPSLLKAFNHLRDFKSVYK